MAADIPMTLLETTVFLNVVQVVPADHDGTLHLRLGDDSGENTATDRAVAGEWALLIDVRSGDGLSLRNGERLKLVWGYSNSFTATKCDLKG